MTRQRSSGRTCLRKVKPLLIQASSRMMCYYGTHHICGRVKSTNCGNFGQIVRKGVWSLSDLVRLLGKMLGNLQSRKINNQPRPAMNKICPLSINKLIMLTLLRNSTRRRARSPTITRPPPLSLSMAAQPLKSKLLIVQRIRHQHRNDLRIRRQDRKEPRILHCNREEPRTSIKVMIVTFSKRRLLQGLSGKDRPLMRRVAGMAFFYYKKCK